MMLQAPRSEPAAGSLAIELQVLGGFALRSGADPLRLTETTQWVIGLLAVRDQPLRRVHLAGVLWPEVTHERSIGSLRSAVWALNKLDAGLLAVDRRSLLLGPRVVVDLRRARLLAYRLIDGDFTSEDLGSAARDLLSRELLAGWYDDWALLVGEEWRQLRAHALESMAAALLVSSRPSDAVLAALEATGADPLRESAHLLVVEAYAAEGNHSRALSHFAEFRDLRAATVGAHPASSLTDIATQLRVQITLD